MKKAFDSFDQLKGRDPGSTWYVIQRPKPSMLFKGGGTGVGMWGSLYTSTSCTALGDDEELLHGQPRVLPTVGGFLLRWEFSIWNIGCCIFY